MSNRGTATLVFGARVKRKAAERALPRAWAAVLPGEMPAGASLYDLCAAADLGRCARGHADSDSLVVGYVIARAHAYSVDVAEVASLDVPDDARAKVARLLAALGITDTPRVLLVAGSE